MVFFFPPTGRDARGGQKHSGSWCTCAGQRESTFDFHSCTPAFKGGLDRREQRPRGPFSRFPAVKLGSVPFTQLNSPPPRLTRALTSGPTLPRPALRPWEQSQLLGLGDSRARAQPQPLCLRLAPAYTHVFICFIYSHLRVCLFPLPGAFLLSHILSYLYTLAIHAAHVAPGAARGGGGGGGGCLPD